MTHLMTMLVLQLAVIIVVAKILGWVFENKLNQPRVLGELAAGMIIGPYEQAINDLVPGRMVPCDEQRKKRGICFLGKTGLLHVCRAS